MMQSKECADAWRTVVECYKITIEENNPKVTMQEIIKKLGIEKTKEVFATTAKIKQYDGRIYGENRKYMDNISINPECVEWKHENPIVRDGLIDYIHTAHINNLITEIMIQERR